MPFTQSFRRTRTDLVKSMLHSKNKNLNKQYKEFKEYRELCIRYKLNFKIEQGVYRPGTIGLQWLQRFCNIPELLLSTDCNLRETNIKQYTNKLYTGKIVEHAHCIDKSGAYITHLINKLPSHKIYDISKYKCTDYCILYRHKINNSYTWIPPIHNVSRYIKEYYYLKKLDGIDEWYKEYTSSIKNINIRKIIKSLSVSIIGKMFTIPEYTIIATYIWYKQGEEITHIRNTLIKNHATILKIHTDSITWVGEFTSFKDYKTEFTDKRIYIVNAGMYHVEGEHCKGYTEDTIEYVDGVVLNTTNDFPCLRAGEFIKKNKRNIRLDDCNKLENTHLDNLRAGMYED